MPDTPPGTEEALAQVARQLELPLTPDAVQRLARYLGLLQRWNATYNLTAIREPEAMLTQHLADCLAIMPSLQARMGDGPRRVLDVGSGAGLPGAVIAIVRPDWKVVCVDAVGKKAAFIRQAALELGLGNLSAEHARVETLSPGTFDLITARAFASLEELVSLTRSCLKPEGVWAAMKGKRPSDEIARLPDDVEVFHVEQLAVPGMRAERCLVWLRMKIPARDSSGAPS